MIDWDKLDINKTYVGLEYGQSNISQLVRKLTKEFCYNMDVPSHVFALCYDHRVGQWLCYESHNLPSEMGCLASGTRRFYKPIMTLVFPQTCIHSDIYELKLDEKILIKNLNKPYGYGDIVKLLRACLTDTNGKQKDFPGLICSEYIALASKDLRDYLKLPTHCITPAHFLKYFLDNDIEKVC